MLVLDAVSCVFGRSASGGEVSGDGVKAVDRLSLEVPRGERLVLIGPSGCGKTTTLRLVAGLDRPTAGHIRFDGQPVDHLPARRRGVAMLFQHPPLYPHLSVKRNIEFGLAQSGGAGGRATDAALRVADVAEWLGIGSLLDRRPAELSGGERQRVALARAIVRRPRVLLLDEPLASLDPVLRADMRRLLDQLHQRLAITTLHVTHDQAEALALGQRLAVMREGRLEQVDTPREVYDTPANVWVARFIGTPPMNLLPARLEQSGGKWLITSPLGSHELAVPVAQKLVAVQDLSAAPFWLGLRAEHVRLAAGQSSESAIGSAARGNSANGNPAAKHAAHVRSVEWCGDRQTVELELPGMVRLLAVLPAERRVAVGDVTSVEVDLTAAHWFGPEGQRIVVE